MRPSWSGNKENNKFTLGAKCQLNGYFAASAK